MKITLQCWLLIIIFKLVFIDHSFAQANEKDTISAQEIVKKYIDAEGGFAELKKISTVYTEMKGIMDGRNVTLIIKEMLPNKGGFEIVYQDRVVYKEFFDGMSGFRYEDGNKIPAAPEEFADKLDKKNIFDELDYLDTSVFVLGYLGTDILDKEAVYKIKATKKNGAERILFFSKESFLLVKKENTKSGETGRASKILYKKFKHFGSILSPTEITMDAGTKNEQKLTITNIYINDKVSSHDFE